MKISKKNIKYYLSVWVKTNYGHSELVDPSWDLDNLSEYLERKLNI